MDKEQAFFETIAATWDTTRAACPARLRRLMDYTGLKQGDAVLDIGTGTGVLIPYIHERIGAEGTIEAVDFSANMLAKAKEKFAGLRGVTFTVGNIIDLPLGDEQYDVITCLNFFPHIHQYREWFLVKLLYPLRHGGTLCIMHDIPRSQVNGIHQSCEDVKDHLLPPAAVVGDLLAQAGFSDVKAYEDETIYVVVGVRK